MNRPLNGAGPLRQAGPELTPWLRLAGPLGLGHFADPWQMEYQERLALVTLLERLRPPVAIEIGTHFGGSLTVMAAYAQKAYSLDIDPTCESRLGTRFPNVEFLPGSSRHTLGPLIHRLNEERAGVGFVLIDGDHSARGVAADVADVLRLVPTRPVYVLMHDSFHPDVRHGILTADWESSPFVDQVQVDFVSGRCCQETSPPGEMWGGFALALLLPERRAGRVQILASHQHHFRTVWRHSGHRWHRRLSWRLRHTARQLLGLTQR